MNMSFYAYKEEPVLPKLPRSEQAHVYDYAVVLRLPDLTMLAEERA